MIRTAIRWIIFALSLGASVTSIIQGVFVLFGLFSMPVEGAGVDTAALVTAGLPILAAVFALLGGCIAFNESRWGALFLALATGLCAFASRDVWIYGGLYMLGAILCFFLPRRPDYDEYDFADSDADNDTDAQEDDYDDDDFDDVPSRSVRERASRISSRQGITINDDFGGGGSRVRRRTSKTCPACGATVAIGHRFCPNCGAPLHVPDGADEIIEGTSPATPVTPVSAVAPVEPVEPVKPVEPESVRPLMSAVTLEDTESIDSVVGFKAATPSQTLSISESAVREVERIVREAQEREDLEVSSMQQGNLQEEAQIRPHPRRVITSEQEPADNMDDEYYGERVRIPTAPRKVVVRPDRDRDRERERNREQPFGNGRIDPDMSYSNFSKYTHRRKKRRRTSLGKRIFGLLLLCGAVGGALWFLLGLRKLPEDELPQFDRPKTETPVPASSRGELVQPVVAQPEPITVTTVDNVGELPPFTPVLTPRRGLISGSNVNLRENHTTDSRAVGKKMSTNTSLELLDSWEGQSKNLNGIWYRVRLGDGREGWVYGRYVQPIGEPLPSGYTNALLRTFGADRLSIVNALGQPARSTSTSMDWSGLSVTFRGEQVSRLRLTSSQRELRNGLRVGMSQAALTQLMGYPSSSSQRQVQYSEGGTAGIVIQLDANGVIQNINVTEVGN